MYGSRDVFWNDPQELQFELEKFHGNENELVLASKMGNHQIVNLLIPKIENINHQNEIGETALFWACMSGDEYSVELLLNAGANPNIYNYSNM